MKKNKPKVDEETAVDANQAHDNESVKSPPTLEDQLRASQAEVAEWKNKYAMVFADMDNLRKSQDKTFMEALRYRAEGFIDKLLPALDAFHIALKNPVDDPKLKNYLVGFDYIYKQIQQAVESEGLKPLKINIGDEFDVRTMNALEAEAAEGKPNKVLRILSQGYQLHDRIVKQALVVVSKAKEVKNDTPQSSHNGDRAA